MKTTTVDDRLYSALENEARRSGRTVQELVGEAIESWLADAAEDDEEYELIKQARIEYAEKGGKEFEAFFSDLLEDKD